MQRGTLWTVVLSSFLVTTDAVSQTILLISDAVPPADGVPNNHDNELVRLLDDAGYSVDTSGMNGAYQEGQAPFGNAAKVAAIAEADLVLVSRRTNSGAYDNDRVAWAAIEKPLVLMSGYLVRNSRWGWFDCA